jgi:hypothetical protein
MDSQAEWVAGGPMNAEQLARFEARTWPEPMSGCWLFDGGGSGKLGYGKHYMGRANGRGVQVYAHRLSYEHHVGPIPEGLELDHLCRNPFCVNPQHLEPVTHLVNMQRGRTGWNTREKTHCPQGHPYEGDNLIAGRNGKYPARRCRTCVQQRTAQAYQRDRQADLTEWRRKNAAKVRKYKADMSPERRAAFLEKKRERERRYRERRA